MFVVCYIGKDNFELIYSLANNSTIDTTFNNFLREYTFYYSYCTTVIYKIKQLYQ